MKKENRKPTLWLIGGLATLTFLGMETMAAAVTSYNDLAWGTGQRNTNITTFTSPNGGSGLFSSGQLKNFDSGNDTAVTLTVTGGSFLGDAQAVHGANPTTGDAFTIFDGKVDGQGALSYIDANGSNLVLTFTNMDENKTYDLTYFANRGANAWDRASLATLSTGVGGCRTNISSVASDNPSETGGVIFSGPSDSSTRLPSDNPNGYVARWNEICPGPDGMITLTISFDGSVGEQFKGKYGSAVRLIESGGSQSDMDGDGKADIVWRDTSTGSVGVWLMNGLTKGSDGIPAGAPTTWTIAGVGDVDGDGKADIVWRDTSNGDVGVWLMNGLTKGSDGIPAGAPTTWTIAGVGDVDGDGKADIVWRDTSNGDVGVWLMNGLTKGSDGIPAGAPTTWTIAGVGDVDGDGKADIVWRDTSNGDVGVWLMNGLTKGSDGIPGTAPTTWTIAGVGDVDGDGKTDIVWRDTSNGDVGVWLMNGLTKGSDGIPGSAPTTWTIAGVGDVDGDGKADLKWRDTSNGDVGVWLMNGLTKGSDGIPGGAPLSWNIQP